MSVAISTALRANYEIKRTPDVALRSDHHERRAPLISALDIVVRHIAGVLPDWWFDFAGMKRSHCCCRFRAGLEGWCSCALVLGLLLAA